MPIRCYPHSMMNVITRNSELSRDEMRGEHKLIFAIINCAVHDLLEFSQAKNAEAFFHHELFDRYCNLVYLNPDATRGLLRKGGYIS